MRFFILSLISLVSGHLFAGVKSQPIHPRRVSTIDSVVYVKGSTQKVCQLTGEKDKEFNISTLSQTTSRYGLTATDRGYSFGHDGKIFFLFGDSSPSDTFQNKPNGQSDPPRTPNDNDAIAFVPDTSTGPCLMLNFTVDSIGAFRNPVVLDSNGDTAITLRTNETPIAGISDSGRMFVIFGTDNFLSNPPGDTGSPGGGATRTVVAVSDDDGNTFRYLYNFSKAPGAKFIMTAIAAGPDGYLYFWGTHGDSLFRKSPPFLARKPVGAMSDSTAIEYLNSVNPDGTPVFMAGEGNATALFHDYVPDSLGVPQLADCMGEVGVEWNPYVHRWIMLYNSSNNTPANPRGIWMRLAPEPWGPWSAPETIFNPDSDNGLCYFIHRAVTINKPLCDSLSSANRLAIQGSDYAPYFISQFTTGDPVRSSSTFYYTMSTWNPYEVVIMKSTVQLSAASDTAPVPTPTGIYVLDDPSNEKAARSVYDTGLVSSPAYQQEVAGHAIFVPIAKILPTITTWGEFNWTWGYVDSLVQIAVGNGKKFSIELETGFQSGSTYLHSLPDGFLSFVDTTGASLFDVWVTGGSGGRGISAYVLLPWNQRVQEFWSAAAYALADHLRQTGVYGSLTMVHVPGLSVYDEELRLPTGSPSPAVTDTMPCPDGRPAYPTVITDADTARWRRLGYSDSAVIAGFSAISTAFADAFPDRVLGLSLFNPGAKGIDFPNLTHDTVGYVAARIVQAVNGIAPGRVQIQSDNLDANFVQKEVLNLAAPYPDLVGWQSNKHAETGAGCDGGGVGSCSPDSSDGPYFQLLEEGWRNQATYIEVWSNDVVNYPKSFAGAGAADLFPNQPPLTRTVSLNQGWNLISSPVDPHNDSVPDIYQSVAWNAFSYSGGAYEVTTTLENGVGYWIRSQISESVTIFGSDLLDDTIPVTTGWNLIGSLSQPVPVSLIAAASPGMITGNFFGYHGGYRVTDTIYPGAGYWVKCTQYGQLILSSSSMTKAGPKTSYRIRIVPTAELPPAPPDGPAHDGGLPKTYALQQAYPNPFNPSTTIAYQLPVKSRVRLDVYDELGRLVTTLVDGVQESGYKKAGWNAGTCASGVYFYRLEAASVSSPGDNFTQVKKVILMK